MNFDPEVIERARALCKEYEAQRTRLLEAAEARLHNLTGDKGSAALHLALARQENERISPNITLFFTNLALADYELEKCEIRLSLAIVNMSVAQINSILGDK